MSYLSYKLRTTLFLIFIILIQDLSVASFKLNKSTGKTKAAGKGIFDSIKKITNSVSDLVQDLVQDNGNNTQDLWVKCANEGETCKFDGERMIKYGSTDGKWNYRVKTDSVNCNSNKLGNVNTNKPKVCFFHNVEHKWNHCADEGKDCSVSGTAIVRYGTGGKFNYKQVTGKVGCKNNAFGDPNPGNKKNCKVMVGIYWKKCANEHGTCKFDGTTIVKYGVEKNWKIGEFIHEVHCSNSVFGDPKKGKSKICVKRMGKIIWIECANERGTCKNMPGAVTMKYGANGKFHYRDAHNKIGCKNSNFGGDPIVGTPKKCYYALYNVGDAPADLSDLAAAEVNEPIDPEDVKETSGCDKNGFGFDGQCLSGSREGGIPSSTESAVAFLGEFIYSVLFPVDVCLGDWSGKDILSLSKLEYNKCNAIPLASGYDYGVIGLNADNVPCTNGPEFIQACAVWDQCGTVALSVNGGLAGCLVGSSGIGAIVAPFAKFLNYISMGFSYTRRFTTSFDIAYNKGSSVAKKNITTFSHFFFKLGLKYPFADLKIGKQAVKNFFTVNADMSMMLDFGNSLTVIESFVNDIRNADSDTAENIVNNIIDANFEATLGIKGSFVLNLNKLSRGFLPNLSFNLFEANLLLTNGNGGSSGMNRGIYFYVKVGFNNLKSVFQKIIDQFSGILSIFGVSITVPNINASVGLGLFIQDDSAGIYLNSPGLSLYCQFIYATEKGSCDYNSMFFTALINGAKWVIKHARQMFENTGKEVVRFSNDAAKFATNATGAVNSYFSNDVKNFFQRDVGNALVNTGSQAVEFVQNEVGGAVDEAGKVISGTASGAIDSLGNVAGNVTKGLSSAFSSAGSALSGAGSSVVSAATSW